MPFLDVALSYNRPKFDSCATWNHTAITFASISTVGSTPYGIFVSIENDIYVAKYTGGSIQKWSNESGSLTRTYSVGNTALWTLFVTASGDIYVNQNFIIGRIDGAPGSAGNVDHVMSVSSSCYGLFIDISNHLYCSLHLANKVVKKWLGDNASIPVVVAGTGTSGNALDQLNGPARIFVDTNFDLYVADFYNHRIQRFVSGELNGSTVAGSGSPSVTITLSYPASVVLDADKYLFIVEYGNHRIIRSGPNGFQCVVGCNGTGPASDQMTNPAALGFDSYGSMFVIDRGNHRVQKFTLSTNSCSKC